MSPILNILKSDLLDLKLDTECWVTSEAIFGKQNCNIW